MLGHHVGDSRGHAKPGDTNLSLILELLVKIPFSAVAIQVDAMDTCLGNAGCKR